jgi:hypothetical protein
MKDGSVGGTSEHRTRPAEIAADGEPARVVQNSRVDKAAAAPSVHGEVWDSYSYDPIEGIQVKIWGTDYDYAPRATAVTDVDGSYSVGALPAGDYLVEFSGEGFITRWWKQQSYETSANVITVTTGGPTIEADAELDHLDTITGTLTSSKGKPIAGRWITLDIWNAQGQHWGELDAVMTNAAGHFAFSDLRPGSYAVEGEVPKGARLKAEAQQIEMEKGEKKRFSSRCSGSFARCSYSSRANWLFPSMTLVAEPGSSGVVGECGVTVMGGKGVTSREGPGSPGPVHPERITPKNASTPSAEMAARD